MALCSRCTYPSIHIETPSRSRSVVWCVVWRVWCVGCLCTCGGVCCVGGVCVVVLWWCVCVVCGEAWHTLSLLLSLSLSCSLSFLFSFTFAFPFFFTYLSSSLAPSLTLAFSLAPSLTLAFSLAPSLTLTLTLTLALALVLSLSLLSLSCSRSFFLLSSFPSSLLFLFFFSLHFSPRRPTSRHLNMIWRTASAQQSVLSLLLSPPSSPPFSFLSLISSKKRGENF